MKYHLGPIGPFSRSKPVCALTFLVLLILGGGAQVARATPSLGNYEFLPIPATANLGATITLIMAGCVDPNATASAPTCPAPTVLADSITAEAGTLRQTSPSEFIYTAPTVMPAHHMVQITASYQHPFQHQVIGVVILVDPKLAASKGTPDDPGASVPGKKLPLYSGFVSVYIGPTEKNGSWQRNLFFLDGDESTRPIRENLADDQMAQFGFIHMVGIMNRLEIDDQGRQHYAEGTETFDGDSEVFSYIKVNLNHHLYGWQVHGDRAGDRPPSSKTYTDPGYNSGCVDPGMFSMKPDTQPFTNLNILSGKIVCDKEKEEGYGKNVILTWSFAPASK